MTADGGRPDDPYPVYDAGRAWSFVDWVARGAHSTPETTAVVDAENGELWTYTEFDRTVARTAGRLEALGFEAGDHLGMLLGTRVAAARIVHAAARLGVVLVPLSARETPATIGAMADEADVDAVVCGEQTEADAVEALYSGETSDDGPSIPLVSVDDPASDHATHLARWDPVEVEPTARSLADPQLILFTSGTTGAPKPVVLTTGNVLASAAGSAFRLGVTPTDRWLCALPTYHMGGIAPILRSAIYGTTAVVQPSADGFDPATTAANLAEHDCTGVSLVPTQLHRLLDEGWDPAPSLRFVLLGGGPASDELIERCADSGVPVCPTYGMTETASQIATARPDEATAHAGTVGRPLSVTDVRVVDGAGEVPPGAPGEIQIRGPTVTPGYYRRPDATWDAFEDGWLATGDRGYRDEAGRLYVLGRIDDRIITGGEMVVPGAVETALCGIAGVEDAAVVGLDDPEWGQRVSALVVLDDQFPESAGIDERSPGALLDAVRPELADYEVPQTLVLADAIPRTASGTPDREAVRELIRDATGENVGRRD